MSSLLALFIFKIFHVQECSDTAVCSSPDLHLVQERFDSLRMDQDIPPFHYGSHYSSAAIVLYYMIRMEPFTRLNRNLQVCCRDACGVFDFAWIKTEAFLVESTRLLHQLLLRKTMILCTCILVPASGLLMILHQ